jgi:hypothetical protein
LPLTNEQIERYARQIIVPGVGGVAQERLLASRMILAGRAADIAPVLEYLTGAGVGDIRLLLPGGDRNSANALIKRSLELNSDVTVAEATETLGELDLIVAVGRDLISSKMIDAFWNQSFEGRADNRSHELSPKSDLPLIAINFDEPATIAIFTARPPCVRCADLPAASGRRQENAGFVAMVATTEALKLLAHSSPTPPPTLLLFSGYACSTKHLGQRALEGKCVCSESRGGSEN